MSLIFPGMDPYLEHPRLWEGSHNVMVVYLADHLQPQVSPRYVVQVRRRTFMEQPAGLEIRESYLCILDMRNGRRVVTVLELLSAANKQEGSGRESYRAKQREVLGSDTHLVEIDLLRYGPHVLAVPEWCSRSHSHYDYLTSVNRAVRTREEFELYRVSLPERLPRVRIPQAGDDPDVALDLQAVLARVYDMGSYVDLLNYDAPCVPPLKSDEQAWADQLIREARQRQAGQSANP